MLSTKSLLVFSMKSLPGFPVMLVLILFASCVRDVDIDQAGEIVIPPTAALDLVYFNLNSSNFQDEGSNVLRAVDETRLGFLDDNYIRDGLVRVDFNFRYTNTFEHTITNTIHFLSENNQVRYTIKFDIPPGTIGNPNTINYTEIIKEDNIDAIRKSIKMRVELEMNPVSENPEAELQLKSRAFYTFEFR